MPLSRPTVCFVHRISQQKGREKERNLCTHTWWAETQLLHCGTVTVAGTLVQSVGDACSGESVRLMHLPLKHLLLMTARHRILGCPGQSYIPIDPQATSLHHHQPTSLI